MRRLTVSVAVLCVVALASCGGASGGGDRPPASLVVFAAASLTDAFTEMADAFGDENEGVSVTLSFAGSSSLREQVLAGAPVDVVALADVSTMDRLVAADAVDTVEVFATNRLAIVVPAGNPGRVTGLDDFGDDGLLIGLCAEEVPCGAFARRALDRAGVTAVPDTDEPDVRALLTKVEVGELDAGIVYASDVRSAGADVEGIDLPEDQNVVATYPIGVVAGGAGGLADAFVDFVLGTEGRSILARHGFGRP